MAVRFARRMKTQGNSELAVILQVAAKPEIISFAGGLPALELFPVEEMKKVSTAVLDEAGGQALQYSSTEGYEPLRRQIAERMNRKFLTHVTYENILITSGSQQVLDFAGKLFLDEDDVVLCESPTYLAAISAFRSYMPRFIEVPTDNQGMKPEALEKILATEKKAKFIYVIPDFQNPSGFSWSLERRKQFMEIINRYEIPVVEDDPYGELRFEGENIPTLKSLDTKGLVLLAGTFSKTFCPGMRIGWVAASPELIAQLASIKQASDLHTSNMGQREVSKYIDMYDFDASVAKKNELYKHRRDVMLEALQKEMPQDVTFTHPQGGLFLWVTLPERINTVELLKKALKNNVAFVPGGAFFPNTKVENTMRLNYSSMTDEKIREGIHRLAEAIKNY